jgi:hypothetical protein
VRLDRVDGVEKRLQFSLIQYKGGSPGGRVFQRR